LSQNIIQPYRYAVSFDPTDVTDLYCWYDPNYGITMDGSNRISKWLNREGTTARDLVQATGALQPLFVASGSSGSGNATVNTSGGDWMETASAQTALTQPISVVAITKFPANGSGNNAFLFDCHTASSDRHLMSKPSLDADDRYQFFAGTDMTLNGATGYEDSWNYVTILFNTSSSEARFNGSSVITGNVGTNDYQALQYNWSGTSANRGWNNEVLQFLIYDKLLSSDDISNLETWAATQMG
jgi:hypothetical protein